LIISSIGYCVEYKVNDYYIVGIILLRTWLLFLVLNGIFNIYMVLKIMKHCLGVLVSILLLGCSNPEIIIHSPTEGQTYVTEAYINIYATINDVDGIKRVSYTIYSNSYNEFPAGFPTTYDLIDTQSMYNFPTGYEVEITIEAEDKLGNVEVKKVKVKHS